jgi:hypothetical protein
LGEKDIVLLFVERYFIYGEKELVDKNQILKNIVL